MTTRALVPKGIVILLVLTLAVAWLWMLGNSPVHGAATLTVTKTGGHQRRPLRRVRLLP